MNCCSILMCIYAYMLYEGQTKSTSWVIKSENKSFDGSTSHSGDRVVEQVKKVWTPSPAAEWGNAAAAAFLRNCHPNKPHSLGQSAPNPLVERLIRVCLKNFPSGDRLKSLLCSRGCLPGWDTPCLPDLICHTASEYVKVLQLWAATRWWSSCECWAGEPSQFQHIPIREEAPCLHPQRDLSPTTGRVEWANPQLSKLKGKSRLIHLLWPLLWPRGHDCCCKCRCASNVDISCCRWSRNQSANDHFKTEKVWNIPEIISAIYSCCPGAHSTYCSDWSP